MLNWKLFLVTVLFLATSVSASIISEVQDLALAPHNYSTQLNSTESTLAVRSILDSHIYKNMSVNTDECEEACKEDPRCASYNFKLDNDFNEICELNECGMEEDSLDISKVLRKLRPSGSLMASTTQQVRSVKEKEKCQTCQAGYRGEGIMCKDEDECRDGTHKCSQKATCTNTEGSHKCKCLPGFTGDGVKCKDKDECTNGTHTCSMNATCNNTVGSYKCKCLPGFTGDGVTCQDIDECANGTHNCSPNATCNNTVGSYKCKCLKNFTGDGVTCNEVCTPGFAEYNSSCYIVIDRPTKKWQVARQTCKNLGGDLVKISSAGENKFILQLATKTSKESYLWIGLVRDGNNDLHWVGGPPLSGSYSNWNNGEPSGSGGRENCCEMYIGLLYTSKWNDIPCDNSYNLVIACQKQK